MNNKNKNFRFERKWVFDNNFSDIYSCLLKSKFYFNSSFPDRKVNSIYFDDFCNTSVKENLEGENDKTKIRIRWYGKNPYILKKPKLELKIKKNFQNYKIIKNLDILNGLNIKNLEHVRLISKKVNSLYKKKMLIPVSTTHYDRSYLISSNSFIRSTVDKNLKVSKFNNNFFIPIFKEFNKIILELKYQRRYDEFVRGNINNISARFSKNSKYIYSIINYYS